ncbi:subclass B1 metallo-beta-lactamase [Hymenobacter taeanensis]|uniref:beta-lactamase n=1 Tax=Hymenobacter taeanensis TaxID=2735321 RepID=A0A6M6BEJ9_9BACT|nr:MULTISPECIES: subclass B1 metallo-beta-lactamase [Hymenobacter]QJX46399.1 subclass B1 metallo-beta-lactamase [Hymenobacter taeanensis]UOQ80260.1 subclass B1 metallo-beta-lactamase [Hymenobacter sp. 5414T-23]
MFRLPAAAFAQRTLFFVLLLLGSLIGLSGPGAALAGPPQPELHIRVKEIAPDVFVHTSYRYMPGVAAPIPANGLIVKTTKGAILLDTGWDSDQTLQLLRWVADSLHQRVRMVVITHAHEDRMGGMAVLRANNIKVVSSPMTTNRAIALKQEAPTPAIKPFTVIESGKTRLELFYPGPGHTPDNLVAWLPKQRVLFGGCLVRDMAADTPGNIEDADLKKWPVAVKTVADRYPRARIVVPGHGNWGGPELLTHTLDVLRRPGRQAQTALGR